MILGIVIAILFLAIVFFHYLQGFFSATLSAIIAVISAVLAFSWHEAVVEKLLQDKLSNISNSIVIVALFAIIYTILRVIFDKVIPGAIRFPAMLDRVGGAVMGSIAAMFGLGIFAIAAEELPLGPSVAGYVKYGTTDKPAQVLSVGSGSHQQEGFNVDELNSDFAGRFDESDRKNLFPWVMCGVDDAVVNTVAHLSDGGSLAGDQALARVHPDFLQEIFAQRLGIQTGAQHFTFGLPTKPAVMVAGIFTVDQVRVSDPEFFNVRPTPPKIVPPLVNVREIMHSIRGGKDNQVIKTMKLQVVGPGTDPDNHDKQLLVVVRLQFNRPAADTEDSNIRFSPGSVRLVANRRDSSGNLHAYDYYPLGTVAGAADGPILYVDKPDDFLVVPLRPSKGEGQPAVDLLYAVDSKGFLAGDKIDRTAFVEFKRMVRLSLAEHEIRPWVKEAPGLVVGNLIKVPAVELGPGDAGYVPPTFNPAAPTGTPSNTGAPPPPRAAVPPPVATPAPAPAIAGSPLPVIPTGAVVNFPGGPSGTIINFIVMAQTPELPVKISVPAAEKNKTLISIPRILEATLKNGQFQELTVNPQATLTELAGNGELPIEQFFVPKNKVAWQIVGDATLDPFDWIRKTPFMSVIDSTGAEIKPFGCWSVINNGGTNYLYSRYNPNYPLDNDSINPVPTVGKELRVAAIFLLPAGATPAQLKIDANSRDLKALRVVTTLK